MIKNYDLLDKQSKVLLLFCSFSSKIKSKYAHKRSLLKTSNVKLLNKVYRRQVEKKKLITFPKIK